MISQDNKFSTGIDGITNYQIKDETIIRNGSLLLKFHLSFPNIPNAHF